jgi:hypothetical protein
MALNPPIETTGEPRRINGEGAFLVNSIEVEGLFTIEKTKTKYKGRGRCKLSQLRIIYINDNKNTNVFSAFDLPLFNITEFKFNQPIFGANNLTGVCTPIGNMFPGNIKFKLSFYHGGETDFVKTFYRVYGQMAIKRANMSHNAANTASQSG